MARRDMPDVVMRFDGLRKAGGSTFLTGCGPQVSLGSSAVMLALFPVLFSLTPCVWHTAARLGEDIDGHVVGCDVALHERSGRWLPPLAKAPRQQQQPPPQEQCAACGHGPGTFAEETIL